MAAIHRPTEATYVIHDKVTVETSDNEDHTFCGILFPVKCKDLLPLDHVVINSLSVRGRLGPLTVWVTNEDDTTLPDSNRPRPSRGQFTMHERYWTKIYEKTHPPSYHTFATLDLSSHPIRLYPGQIRGIYIHSTLPGDEALVYDNQRQRRTYDDPLVAILTGRAHVSCDKPFGTTPIWGWGSPWRDHREFVGRIDYGAVYQLWNPQTAKRFGKEFQTLVRTLFLCQRRWESPMSWLPDDCIFYILNMCRWDWATDTPETMKELRTRRRAIQAEERAKAKAEEEARARAEEEEEEAHAKAEAAAAAQAEGAVAEAVTAALAEQEAQVQAETAIVTESCRHRREAASVAAYVMSQAVDADDDDDDDDEDYYVYEALDSKRAAVEDDDDNDEEEEEDIEEDGDSGWGDSDDDDEDEYLSTRNIFQYHDSSEDDGDDDDEDGDDDQDALAGSHRGRSVWIRRQFARIHVLQALAAMDDHAVVHEFR